AERPGEARVHEVADAEWLLGLLLRWRRDRRRRGAARWALRRARSRAGGWLLRIPSSRCLRRGAEHGGALLRLFGLGAGAARDLLVFGSGDGGLALLLVAGG